MRVPEQGGTIEGIAVPKKGLDLTLVLESGLRTPVTFTVVQKDGGRVVGGSTFIVRRDKEPQ